MRLDILFVFAALPTAMAWAPQRQAKDGSHNRIPAAQRLAAVAASTSSTWFSESPGSLQLVSLEKTKAQVLQLGAALDRGQSYNPTSGAYYEDTMKAAKGKIEELVEMAGDSNIPSKLEDMEGEWELVLSTVPHGIFRSR